jgi:hypothetical protein
MIDRYSNNVAITSQDRLQPMDKWEDYPIKVLDMAPLIMVTLPTKSSSFCTWGCFLRVERSSSEDLPPLSQACGWPLSVNDSLLYEWRRLHELRVEDPSGARKGGRTDPGSEACRPAWADRPRPISARLGRPFAFVGPHVFMHFAPSIFNILTMSSSHPRWRFFLHELRSFTLQSSGMFLRSTSVLATIGSAFIKLINTNKTP